MKTNFIISFANSAAEQSKKVGYLYAVAVFEIVLIRDQVWRYSSHSSLVFLHFLHRMVSKGFLKVVSKD